MLKSDEECQQQVKLTCNIDKRIIDTNYDCYYCRFCVVFTLMIIILDAWKKQDLETQDFFVRFVPFSFL